MRLLTKRKLYSFCSTCMNREKYFEKTFFENYNNLKSFFDDYFEYIILNYSSKGNLNDIFDTKMCNLDNVTYIVREDEEYFKHSHAKNIAHVNSKGDILVNVDCDNFISENFLKRICSIFDLHSNNYVHGLKGIGLGGRITISRENFYKVGGYDERMISGWGYEDPELLERCRKMGLEVIKEKINGEKCFKQNNKERGENCLIKRIKKSDKLHRNLKGELSRSFGKDEVKILKRCKY